MKYNFINELFNGTFSNEKDYKVTLDDFINIDIESAALKIPKYFWGKLNSIKGNVQTIEMFLYGTAFNISALEKIIINENKQAFLTTIA